LRAVHDSEEMRDVADFGKGTGGRERGVGAYAAQNRRKSRKSLFAVGKIKGWILKGWGNFITSRWVNSTLRGRKGKTLWRGLEGGKWEKRHLADKSQTKNLER